MNGGTASRAQPASLLGDYPVPALHLVGAPIPPNPRSPSRWQPIPPPLQYGIDYTFAHRVGRQPVRWQQSSGITVRIIGSPGQDGQTALVAVVGELRGLTRLELVVGEPARERLIPSAVPVMEIHVGYLAASGLADLSDRLPEHHGLGGATRCQTGCCYVRGFAVVNVDLAGPDATSDRALAILRHQLGHALGLGHAARPGLVMHARLAGAARYGRGDRHGLALLGSEL